MPAAAALHAASGPQQEPQPRREAVLGLDLDLPRSQMSTASLILGWC